MHVSRLPALFCCAWNCEPNFRQAVDPAAAPELATGVPPVHSVTDAKGARTQIHARPRSRPDVIYIGLNDRDKAWHDLYKLKRGCG